MKKTLVCALFSLIFALLFSSVALADVIPGDSHSLERCVKVVNLNEFPNIVLIGYYTGPMVDNYETYQIENNVCLEKGYKFNKLNVYWDAVDASHLLLENVESYGGYVDNSNPLIKEDIEYSVVKVSEGKFILYKSKQVSNYNNGTSQKIEIFQNPQQNEVVPTPTPTPTLTPTPSPQPVKLKFWQSVICFLMGLFGKTCQYL